VTELNPNLTPSRGPSVWSREGWHGDEPSIRQRMLAGVAGAALLAAAWRWSSTAAAFAGAGLLALAAVEDGPARASTWARRWLRPRRGDRVTYDSSHSFPASDSPGWTATDSSYPG
jgi:hypothetical protein